jgi:predicted nucleic acid-binding protein
VAFADTSFYIAFANPKDRWHEMATAAAYRWRGTIVTTETNQLHFL